METDTHITHASTELQIDTGLKIDTGPPAADQDVPIPPGGTPNRSPRAHNPAPKKKGLFGRVMAALPEPVLVPLAGAARLAMTPVGMLGYERAMRFAGGLGAIVPRVHRSRFERAASNLRDAYPEWDEARVRATAIASYQHLCKLGVEFTYTPRLITREGCMGRLAFTNIEPALLSLLRDRPTILVSGHIGNWELIGYAIAMLGFDMAAVYKPLQPKPIDAWVRDARGRMGLTLVSKFGAVKALPKHIAAGRPVGLVADQSGGDRGVFSPFFGRLTSTYKSIGILAMQTRAQVVCGFARRLGPGERPPGGVWEGATVCERFSRGATRQDPHGLAYSVELVDHFGPEDWESRPDALYYICARYRRAMEVMVRRAPEQYLWMHRIWRSRPAHERLNKPFPRQLREKMLALPWMTGAEVEAIVERSEQDRAALHAAPQSMSAVRNGAGV